MMGVSPQEADHSDFVEVDPTGRYGRYNEILGKGSSKIVYKAFDEYEGVEVAWNQVKLYSFLQSPEDLERLYCEIHLLKTLKHRNIMKFYTSWVDTSKRNINFITEMFTSGTLRQYRQKHKRVNIRAVKHWCRQILSGLLYLHSHDPPVIHRDLKCDNIFVNGNQGVVKIGDLGLAAILRKSHAAHCVGTPEFMAPEVYEEEYNELVDIYSFGMCVLEMVTFEYPYSECIHPAHIYKKVISGTMPEALYKVEDPEVRQFVEKCLVTASERLPARELMKDPFLQIEDNGSGCREEDIFRMDSIVSQPSIDMLHSNGSLPSSDFSGDFENDLESALGRDYGTVKLETEDIALFNNQEEEYFPNLDITIRGRRKEDGQIFLRLRIEDVNGRVRNIYFPFDIEADTALSVATEMVAELDITDFEVTRIAEMIDSEVSLLVPEWKPGPGFEEVTGDHSIALCQTCTSNDSSCGSFLDFFKSKVPGCGNHKSVQCLECASMHGRFEEITYRTEESEQCTTKDAVALSAGLQSHSMESEASHSHQEGGKLDHSDKDAIHVECPVDIGPEKSDDDYQKHQLEMSEFKYQDLLRSLSDEYENEIEEEFESLKENYQMEPSEYKKRQLAGLRRVLHQSLDFSSSESILENGVPGSLNHSPSEKSNHRRMESFHIGTHFSFPIPTVDVNTSPNASNHSSNHPDNQRAQHGEANLEMSPKSMLKARSLREGIRRTKSLLAEVVECLKL